MVLPSDNWRLATDDCSWRGAVVAEALSWRRTPYHPCGRIKGLRGGVDCACFIAEVYERAGVTPHIEIASYPPDWHLHQAGERFLEQVLPRAQQVAAPEPGDLAMWRVGRAFAHAAIVLDWPRIIHADRDARMVTEADARQGRLVVNNDGTPRLVKFFSPDRP